MDDKVVIFRNFERKAKVSKKRKEIVAEAQLTLGQKLARSLRPLVKLAEDARSENGRNI